MKNLWVSYVFEKSWKSCYKLCKKIAEKGPKDTDNDATPDLYAMDELKPEEKKDIAKIQKIFLWTTEPYMNKKCLTWPMRRGFSNWP